MNLVSVIIGLVSAVFMLVGLIPLLGVLNWLVLPSAAAGAILGAFGRKKTGLIINLIVIFVSAVRLLLGGGIL